MAKREVKLARAENQAWIRQRIDEASAAAIGRYNRRYDNLVYLKATQGKSLDYSNALSHEALALCGHPKYKITNRRWGVWAERFLADFCIPSIR